MSGTITAMKRRVTCHQAQDFFVPSFGMVKKIMNPHLPNNADLKDNRVVNRVNVIDIVIIYINATIINASRVLEPCGV